jgi:chorismate synthase
MLGRLSFRSAGESHGAAVITVLEGVPRGLALDLPAIDAELRRRQGGAGRGGRQRVEDDRVEVLAGLRRGRTIGSPLCISVRNRDASIDQLPEPSRPRPGHADLAGCYHWLDTDIRSTLERASARETVARVVAGTIAAQLLAVAGTEVFGFVRQVHAVRLPEAVPVLASVAALVALRRQRDESHLYTLDATTDAAMLAAVQGAAEQQDTVGGVVEVHALPVVPGLGSCVQWDERLDARLAAALMSVPAIKAVEIGAGFAAAGRFGSEFHDPILPASGAQDLALPRGSNRAGGLEGGMTNGQPVVVRAAMKPISTLRRPLPSVDLQTGAPEAAGYERSDVCAVSAASVIAQAMVALVLADALLLRVGGESIDEFTARLLALRREQARLGRAAPALPDRPEHG